MNWNKILTIGVGGGFILWLYNFVMHGMVMGNTYLKYSLFRQDGNPLWFLLVFVLTAVFAAMLFIKTRKAWGAGPKGGATFGFWMGLISYFPMFISPLTISGFPYYLAWCWGAISLIGWVILGAVAGWFVKK